MWNQRRPADATGLDRKTNPATGDWFVSGPTPGARAALRRPPDRLRDRAT